MKSVRLAEVLLVFCFIISCGAFAAAQTTGGAGDGAGQAESMFRQAIDLKENGDYDASLAILDKLSHESQGLARYEIARLDVMLDQSREMKENKNSAWEMKAREAGHRIKLMRLSQSGNGDFWVIYAKYSSLVEARNEGHITKALHKAFYFKPKNPEAYIARADYYFDTARQLNMDPGQQYGMGNTNEKDAAVTKFKLAKNAQESYEAALAGPVSDARRAYIMLNLGELEARILGNGAAARNYWDRAVQLAPGSKAGMTAAQRLKDKK